MIDLSTKYMGFELKNPIIAASSGMTDTVDKVKNLEINGAGAVVLKSLFEEQIMMEIDAVTASNVYNNYGDADDYISYYTRKHNVDNYLKLIEGSKEQVDIPVIASLNSFSIGQWVNFAERIESAGADALELNMFILPGDQKFSGQEIEEIYFDIIRAVRKNTSLPIAIKLSTYFSGMADSLIKMSREDISAMVLFNRFYSPDVDLDDEKMVSSRIFSMPGENSNSIRWIGMVSDKVQCDLAASTGIADGYDVLKNLLVGAKAVQVASTIYKNTAKHIDLMLKQMEAWMIQKEYQSLDEFIGKLSYKKIEKPIIYERAQFMKYFSSFENE
ncbi:MAG: dihydroorotate dehydrogenase-like protein [Bacteroidales bacterium]|nr:dihydroorotate dehydrogenase-like protein [Bacteroidales bacterium]